MISIKQSISAVVLGFAAFAACGGSTDEGASSSPRTMPEFVAQLAAAVCTTMAPCCQEAGLPYAAAECTALLTDGFAKLFGSQVEYDSQKGAECLAFTENARCSERPPGVWPCLFAVKGLVPAGGSCTTHYECVRPTGGWASCREGACVQLPRGRLGDGCWTTCTGQSECGAGSGMNLGNAICYTEDGLACASEGRCVAVGHLGEACASDTCAPPLHCDATSEKCAGPAEVGEPCTLYDEQCVEGSYCSGDLGCASERPIGASCAEDFECESHGCSDGKCKSAWIVPGACDG